LKLDINWLCRSDNLKSLRTELFYNITEKYKSNLSLTNFVTLSPNFESHCPENWRQYSCVLKRNKNGNIEDEMFRSVEVSETYSRMERKESYGILRY
jgi:hypothetical protein